MRLLLLPLLGLVALLSSCIDGEEEIWLEKDGSGRLEATYKMPEPFMKQLGGAEGLAKKLKEAAAKDESLTIDSISHRLEGGRVVFEFSAEFDDLRELAKFPQRHLRSPKAPGEPVPEEALFGKIDLRLSGLVIELYREVDLAPILPDTIKGNPAFLGESTFRYTFHLPVPASEHDAHDTGDEGKTLTWAFLLREHTAEPMTIWTQATLPLPWWIWFSGVLIVILFLLVLIWAVKYTIAVRA